MRFLEGGLTRGKIRDITGFRIEIESLFFKINERGDKAGVAYGEVYGINKGKPRENRINKINIKINNKSNPSKKKYMQC